MIIKSMMHCNRIKESIPPWVSLLGLAGLLVILSGCEPWDLERLDHPFVITREAQEVTSVSAKLGGELRGLVIGRVSRHGFVWSATDPAPELDAPGVEIADLRGRESNGLFSYDLFPLETQATYYYRAFAVVEGYPPFYGEVMQLQTTPASLAITMVRISRLSEQSTTFTGLLEGLPPAVEVGDHGFIWSSASRLPEVGEWDTLHLGPSRNNGCFTQKVDFEFLEDTTYYVFSFVETAGQSFNSNRLAFTRRGGWRESSAGLEPVSNREGAVAFTLGDQAYFGAGTEEGEPGRRFWSLSSQSGAQPAPEPGLPGEGLAFGVGFALAGKGYVGTGLTTGDRLIKDFWVFDPTQPDPWSALADVFPGEARQGAVAFVIGSRAYVGLGRNESGEALADFWVYESGTGWAPLNADNPGPSARSDAVAFVLEERAYVGVGVSGGFTREKDFYRYDPVSNRWAPIAGFPGDAIDGAVAFTAGGKGYVGLGSSLFGALRDDFWAYRPDLETWEAVDPFPGAPRLHALAFTLDNTGWIGLGSGRFQPPGAEFWQLPGDEVEQLELAEELCPE